jgi:hypothetical protein
LSSELDFSEDELDEVELEDEAVLAFPDRQL